VGDAVATSRTAACVGALGDNLRAAAETSRLSIICKKKLLS